MLGYRIIYSFSCFYAILLSPCRYNCNVSTPILWDIYVRKINPIGLLYLKKRWKQNLITIHLHTLILRSKSLSLVSIIIPILSIFILLPHYILFTWFLQSLYQKCRPRRRKQELFALRFHHTIISNPVSCSKKGIIYPSFVILFLLFICAILQKRILYSG